MIEKRELELELSSDNRNVYFIDDNIEVSHEVAKV